MSKYYIRYVSMFLSDPFVMFSVGLWNEMSLFYGFILSLVQLRAIHTSFIRTLSCTAVNCDTCK